MKLKAIASAGVALSIVVFVILLVSSVGCSSVVKPGSALDRMRKDGAPPFSVNPDIIKDAIPRKGEITRAGNKNPYTVLGKTYHLLATSKGYKKQGIASWYGTKFHGRPTANGERYSLYGMTAAHKTLPIPAYVKVTNLDNNKTTIVRVNDRGPFHDDRIIDLSYAAAVKLGYADRGTARVLVEAIDLDAPQPAIAKVPESSSAASSSLKSPVAVEPLVSDESQRVPVASVEKNQQFYLQVGAFKSQLSADTLRKELQSLINYPVLIELDTTQVFYRVQVGAINTMAEVNNISQKLVELGKGQPQVIKR